MRESLLSLVILLSCTAMAGAIPNPAAVYCTESGYQYENGDCVFPDGSRCSAWNYYCNCEPDSGFCLPGGDYDCHWPCEELPCKQAGEGVLVSECCPGLSKISPSYIYDEQCNFNGMTGWIPICSDCGNGICESWESKCNCLPDCADIIISDCPEEVDELEVHGTVSVINTGCLIINNRSYIDGDGAHLIVDGGSILVNARFDMGRGADAYLTVQNGGSFTQTGNSSGLKLPDDDGGEHRIIIKNGGTVHCDRIELRPDWDAEIHIGPDSTLILDHSQEIPLYSYDPQEWLDNGWLVPISPTQLDDISIKYVGEQAIVTTVPLYPWATDPIPPDGTENVRSAVTELVLAWTPGEYIGYSGREVLYFSTDYNDVNEANDIIHPAYQCTIVPPAPSRWAIGALALWQSYYWRVDTFYLDDTFFKGDIWSFSTGCELIPGDINRDCILNFEDLAEVAEGWGQEHFWPPED